MAYKASNDIFTKRQIEIAKKVLSTPRAIAGVMGGMTKEEAKALLKKLGVKYKNENRIEDKIDKYLNEVEWPDNEAIWGKPKRADYKDLGYSNGWKDTPDIVKRCEKKHHKLNAVKVDRSVTEYFCEICKYKYQVDSSD